MQYSNAVTVEPQVSSKSALAGQTYWTIFILLFGFLIVLSCSGNVRYYTRQNVRLSAMLRYGEASYRDLRIGTPSQPFYKNVKQYGDVTVELAGGEIIALGEISVRTIESLSKRTRNVEDLGYETPWPRGTRFVEVGKRLCFYVKDERIMELIANSVGVSEKERPPRFGKAGLQELYSMPFDEQQVVELFGRPDTLSDVFQQ